MKLILLSECPKCGVNDSGPTCCGKGGSWKGKCGPPGDEDYEHTWDEGIEICTIKTSDPKTDAECPDNKLDPSMCECGVFEKKDENGCSVMHCNIYCAAPGKRLSVVLYLCGFDMS